MSKRLLVVVGVILMGLFGLSGTVNSQTVETFIPNFGVFCTSTGQRCDPPFSVSVETGSVLQVQYFVRSTHCSSIRVHIFVDGTLKVTTGFLGWPGAPAPFDALPLDTGLLDLGPVSPGTHLVSVQAEGQVSGCNRGQLFSWGGSLKVLTSPRATTVQIDIKPGSFPNSINPRSRGVMPVAILTTATFDATTADPATVRFGRTGTEAAPVHTALEDVDGDGDTDMILHFNTQDTGIQCGDTSASLTGETFGGQAIVGSDSINTVGC